MIEVKNLTKKYGNNVAIDALSFTIDKGQIYGFLGPNGAGKSTTMNIITGYIAATEGEVSVNGYDIVKEPRKAKACIGYLPEVPPLYQDMTVREYLNFAAELKGIRKTERHREVEDAEKMTQIDDVSGRLIKNLSKGYKQRVGLAQAIIGLPEILILDEPTAGLDPKQIIEIRDLIKQLGEKHTIIMSSHILSEVSAVCDHIMIISKGRLVASDTADNLMKMMQSETALDITVRTDPDTADSILSGIEHIEDYSVSESEEAGASDAVIRYKSEFDLRDEIFKAFTDSHYPIIRMNTASASLEDVFLELTDDDFEVGGYEENGAPDEAEHSDETAEAEAINGEPDEYENAAEQDEIQEPSENDYQNALDSGEEAYDEPAEADYENDVNSGDGGGASSGPAAGEAGKEDDDDSNI